MHVLCIHAYIHVCPCISLYGQHVKLLVDYKISTETTSLALEISQVTVTAGKLTQPYKAWGLLA